MSTQKSEERRPDSDEHVGVHNGLDFLFRPGHQFRLRTWLFSDQQPIHRLSLMAVQRITIISGLAENDETGKNEMLNMRSLITRLTMFYQIRPFMNPQEIIS